MAQRFVFACLVGLAIVGSVVPASAFGPVNSAGSTLREPPDLLDASFFGRPYPYGYTGWGPCIRYIQVETRWGIRLRRVWVCR